MGQNAKESDDLKERIFQKILSDSSVTGEQWIQLFAQLKESPETVVERLKGDTVRQAPWLHLFPWAAFFTLLGGVVTAVVTGGFDLLKGQNEQDVGLQIKQMERQAAIFQHVLIIDPDTIAGGADEKNFLNWRRRSGRQESVWRQASGCSKFLTMCSVSTRQTLKNMRRFFVKG
jgi:hypothetical protein